MATEFIENPTYLEHIRFFFDGIDLSHMLEKGIDLSTYEKLKGKSADVYLQVAPPTRNMPPSPQRKWDKNKVDSFRNWIQKGHPLGKIIPQKPKLNSVARVRKNCSELSSEEIEKLRTSFQGIMDLPNDDPNSYFYLAGLHWYPSDPPHCKHHEPRYNPWHRAYLQRFEDALRSIEGCEDVTLPYWDITQAPPSFLYTSPFRDYTLPKSIHRLYQKGYKTKRYSANKILNNVKSDEIPQIIEESIRQSTWEEFVTSTGRGIEAAHDFGHGACGDTLQNPDAAAFDPLFWFFHANWDRLWWKWQQIASATDIWGFRSTITGSTDFLEPPFNELTPFSLNAAATINLNDLGVGYTVPKSEKQKIKNSEIRLSQVGSGGVLESLRLSPQEMASVRIKNLDRVKIPGTFRVNLKANGKKVGSRVFFQSIDPTKCENCVKNRLISLDFLVPIEQIMGKEISAEIHLLKKVKGLKTNFPLSSLGSPTINVRLKLNRG